MDESRPKKREKNTEEGSLNTPQALLRELQRIQDKLMWAETKFNLLEDEDLIESSIYEINALTARYGFLIKMAKEKQISCDR